MPQPILKNLPVHLDDDEILERARRQAATIKEINDLNAAFDIAKKEFKQRVKKAEQLVQDLGQVVREGKEYRPVECVERADRRRKVIETVRTDTREVVDTRNMTATEAQLSIEELEEHLTYMTRD